MKSPPRRPGPTGPPRTKRGGRSERVVRDVLRATAVELANVGYAGLRVDDVAVRAGVNKTTIYRRWPSKVDLIRDLLRTLGPTEREKPDTGSVRADLLRLVVDLVNLGSTPEGYSIMRMITIEMDNPEIRALTLSLHDESNAVWLSVIGRGIKRGELPAGTDASLLAQMIISPVISRLLLRRDPVDHAFLLAVVDTTVLGAKAGGAIPVPSLGPIDPPGGEAFPGARAPSSLPDDARGPRGR